MFEQLPSSGKPARSGASLALFTFVTTYLIVINIGVFVLMTVRGVSLFGPTTADLVRWGADFAPMTLNGDWWRLLTASFVHIGPIHIAMNMLVLFQIGLLTERLFGKLGFTVLYLLAAIGGSLTSLYWHPMIVTAGASGAVFGVYGGLIGYLVLRRIEMPAANFTGYFKNALGFLFYNLIYGLMQPRVDLAAHIGGFITGFAAGYVLTKPLPAFDHSRWGMWGRSTAVAMAGVVLAWVSFHQLPASSADQTKWIRNTLLGPSVSFGSDRLFYEGASSDEAQMFGKALQKVSLFRDKSMTVLLTRNSKGDDLWIPVKDQLAPAGKNLSVSSGAARAASTPTWEKPEIIRGFQIEGRKIGSYTGSAHLRLRLLNSSGIAVKDLDISEHEITVGERDILVYSGKATEADAAALGQELQRLKYFTDKGTEVHLAMESSGTVLSFVVKEGVWSDLAYRKSIPPFVRELSRIIGGLPIKVHLLNMSSEVRGEILVQ